jgi:hypothetical protein
MARIGRRRALRTLAAGGLGAATSSLWVEELGAFARQQAAHVHTALAAADQSGATWSPKVLSPQQLETVATLSELIIPQTDTPGARAAMVDRFIDTMLIAAPAADRDSFLAGLAWIDARSQALTRQRFATATPAQQTELLTRLSSANSREARQGIDFFTAIKGLTITGYYTTQIGLQQELGDDGVLAMGSFEGCTHPEHQ